MAGRTIVREIRRTFRIDMDRAANGADIFAPVTSFRGVPLRDGAGRCLPVRATDLLPGARDLEPCRVASRLALVDLLLRAQPEVADVAPAPAGFDLLVEAEVGPGFGAREFAARIAHLVAQATDPGMAPEEADPDSDPGPTGPACG